MKTICAFQCPPCRQCTQFEYAQRYAEAAHIWREDCLHAIAQDHGAVSKNHAARIRKHLRQQYLRHNAAVTRTQARHEFLRVRSQLPPSKYGIGRGRRNDLIADAVSQKRQPVRQAQCPSDCTPYEMDFIHSRILQSWKLRGIHTDRQRAVLHRKKSIKALKLLKAQQFWKKILHAPKATHRPPWKPPRPRQSTRRH